MLATHRQFPQLLPPTARWAAYSSVTPGVTTIAILREPSQASPPTPTFLAGHLRQLGATSAMQRKRRVAWLPLLSAPRSGTKPRFPSLPVTSSIPRISYRPFSWGSACTDTPASTQVVLPTCTARSACPSVMFTGFPALDEWCIRNTTC